jgi:mannitol/fructose-specific phosphotransferase system IIA component
MLKSGEMEIDKAQAINGLAQTLVASAKVEVDYIKSVGGMNDRSGFIEGESTPAQLRLAKG